MLISLKINFIFLVIYNLNDKTNKFFNSNYNKRIILFFKIENSLK
jgi:hypothetical protein